MFVQMVKDKITLCRQMLPESAGVERDATFSEVVGFLEACRPRMVDLVEAGVGGALGEDTFAKCLQVGVDAARTLHMVGSSAFDHVCAHNWTGGGHRMQTASLTR